jgi:uncharacterized protein (TIGR03437 family)
MPALTLPANADSYLVLFGTGIRGRSSLSNVSLTLGGIPATVTYAGVQGTFPGLDQVVAKISPANRPAGIVDIRLTVDGIEANPLRMSLR